MKTALQLLQEIYDTANEIGPDNPNFEVKNALIREIPKVLGLEKTHGDTALIEAVVKNTWDIDPPYIDQGNYRVYSNLGLIAEDPDFRRAICIALGLNLDVL